MRNLPRTLLSLSAALALAAGSIHPAAGQAGASAPPPAKKESKDLKLAKQLHVQYTMQMGVHDDLELQEYVQRIGEKLAAVSERPELEWKFTIVDTDDVNAFATLEGYVYVSRGILPYLQNEAQLAAVILDAEGAVRAMSHGTPVGPDLGIEPVDEPEALERMDHLERGSLIHAILERFLKTLGRADPPRANARDRHVALLLQGDGLRGKATGSGMARNQPEKLALIFTDKPHAQRKSM